MARTQIGSDLILNNSILQEDLADTLNNSSRPYDYIYDTETILENTHYVLVTEIKVIGNLIIEGTLAVL